MVVRGHADCRLEFRHNNMMNVAFVDGHCGTSKESIYNIMWKATD